MAKIKELVVTEFKGSDTEQNLAKAFVDEASGYFKYSLYAVLAKYEGQDYISKIFEDIAQNEKEHEERYRKLLENVKNNTVFEKPSAVVWECANCGHTFEGEKAPELCPVCKHPKAYFFMKAKNY